MITFKNNLAPNATVIQFPLTDNKAKYYISGNLQLFFIKDNIEKSVAIKNGASYQNNIGDQVKVSGRFVEIAHTVYCIKAPCPPIKETQLEIDSIQVIKAKDASFFANNNSYDDDHTTFKFPNGFSHNTICNSQDNHCTVNFVPTYNPYGKDFSFSTFQLIDDKGKTRNASWFWDPEFKILSSKKIIKNNTQWTKMDVQINYTGLVATYYRLAHDNNLYEFGQLKNTDGTADLNTVKITEGILETFSIKKEF